MVGRYLMFFQQIPHTMLYSDRAGYLSPFSLHSSSTNLISQKFSDAAVIVAISVSRRCTLDLSVVKAQGSIAGFLFSLPFCHSTKSFTDHFVTARVDFGIAFSIKFLSSSVFLGFRKALEQDAMSSSVSRRKYKTRVRFDFLAYNLIPNVFLRRMLISNVHKSIIVMNSLDARFSKNVFEAVQKTRSTCFIGSKTTRLRLGVLNPIKHSCSFFKHYLKIFQVKYIFETSSKCF